MVSIKSRSYITVLLHVFSWMLFAFVLFFHQPLSWNITVPFQFWIKQGCILIMLIVVFYVNSKILVPQLLLKNKILAFVLVILVIAILAGPFVKIIEEALNLPDLMNKAFSQLGNPRPPKRSNRIDVLQIMMTLFTVGISTSVTLIQKWQADKQSRETLEKEKIGSELSFLKAQINPHFFFNTLNNIYALTHVDIEKSRSALHKLSRMMRYLLYETQTGITPLSKEISFIVDYIELMKLRLNDTTTVVFKAPALQSDPRIAPMLFLPYIENAFKYGVSTTEPSVISIDLELQDKYLTMIVKNSIFKNNSITADEYGGIGLRNTKRRLELLYPGKHTFRTSTTDAKEFIVNLNLTLDDTELHSS
ncbi:MAG TPA: sensor histidine kinase [Pedobacter sp.]|uniref:sensor histidine kinase n=1 Tax=Pedobacter sp. TaxID=1411316 RepID=UPI002CE5F8C0|nr:sensor histidine kinase [Pedobacter sp.]HMI02783.1 sensor histidine kinase [Pedobacter sp.]